MSTYLDLLVLTGLKMSSAVLCFATSAPLRADVSLIGADGMEDLFRPVKRLFRRRYGSGFLLLSALVAPIRAYGARIGILLSGP